MATTTIKVTVSLSKALAKIASRHRLTKSQVVALSVARFSQVPSAEQVRIVDEFAAKEIEQCGTTGTRPPSTKEPSIGSSKTSARARQQPKT